MKEQPNASASPTPVYPDPCALGPAAIEKKAATIGKGKANLTGAQSFVLAMLAGFFIGIGAMFMLLVKSDASLSFAASSVFGAMAFSVGLCLVLVAGAELFTGNSLMIIGRMHGNYSWGKLLRSWGIVYVGNLCGSLLLVALLVGANYAGMGKGAVGATMVSVAAAKTALPWGVIFFRGIMCNVLVCLAVWMGFGAKTVIDKFLCAILPVTCFVACGFEHCVANMFFIPMGLVANSMGLAGEGAATASLTLGGFLSNLTAATLGNLVGGVILIGLSYWFVYGRASK